VSITALAIVLAWVAIVLIGWLGYLFFVHYGRLLLRVEGLERHLGDLEGLRQPASVQPAPADSGTWAQTDDSEGATAPLQGLPPSTVLHDFELPDLNGHRHLRSDWLGQPFLMLFVNPVCPHSKALMADLSVLLSSPAATWPSVMIVSTGPLEGNRSWLGDLGERTTVLIQEEMEVGALFEVDATPMAYLVDEDGRTASTRLEGRAAIVGCAASSVPNDEQPLAWPATDPDLLRTITTPAPVNGGRYQDGLGEGSVAPDFRLPGVNQDEVALGRFRGRRVLLVFVDPVCPPCDDLLPLLERAHCAESGPAIVLVSRGDLETNRAWAARLGLTMPIGIQRRWSLSREYGLLATPSGYLIDERGALVRPVALGADEILSVATGSGLDRPE
jgi:peroxiredoxin